MSTDTKPGTELTPQLIERGKMAEWTANPAVRTQIADALGNAMDSDMFIAHAKTAFADPALSVCTPYSKYRALHQLAALALLPTLDQVALVPYFDKEKGETVCTVTPQWQGYKALMLRNPDIQDVDAFLVHPKDKFKFVDGTVKHRYDPFDPERIIKTVADIRGGYLRIVYRDKRPNKYHMVPAAHIAKSQSCSRRPKLWAQWFEQMALKTCYRDAYARRAVPMDPAVYVRMANLVQADDAALANDPNLPAITNDPSIADQAAQHEPQPASRTESLAAKLKAEQAARLEQDRSVDATVVQEEPPAAQTVAKPFDWKTATIAERTQYGLDKVAAVNSIADPTRGLEELAKISKGVTEQRFGKEGYLAIMRAITEAEKAFLPPPEKATATVVDAADPFAPAPELVYLQGRIGELTSAAEFDELAKRWSEDSHSIGEDVYNSGVALIQKAKETRR